ncbi:MAG: malonyl-ACP O-methyltransferase BioC [Rikenellaceae bacterium]
MAFDKSLIEKRFASHLDKYNTLASVQKEICQKISELITQHIDAKDINSALEIGIGTGFLSAHLLKTFAHSKWTLNDLTKKAQEYTDKLIDNQIVNYIWGDGEKIEFPGNLDLIASASTVQWFDNLEAFIKKCSRASNKNAYLVLSTFGLDNFKQIKQTTGQGLDYFTLEQITKMLKSNNYEIITSTQYTENLRFNSPLEVLHHIKSTGVNSIKNSPWTKSTLSEFCKKYQELTPQGIFLTYEPIILIARKTK